ncbi:ROK family protein [Clostridium botulinum]|uniref:ROK family protein n=1 Tax=Clostridium botulinum TaxID=1491 RepID=UPI0019685C89|nr:ROK family protein [Clostridium botulinum]MBN1071066.1 ROK family protein [Clostridium botulinum]
MEIRETKDLRSLNKIKIIQSILYKKQISRADLSTFTSLNKATVSVIVKELLDLRLIEESTIGDSTGGRKPIILTINEDIGYVIAIDINITMIDIIVTNLSNKILSSYSIKNEDNNFETIFNNLFSLIHKIQNVMPSSIYNLVGISLAVRGVVDLNGLIKFIPQLGWKNIDIRSKLENEFNVPIYIENDGNLSAMAEHKLMPNYNDMLVVDIDDVITSGIICNSQLVKGFLGFANAIGHHVINCDGKQCTCGKRGCLEQYCSNLAILSHINQSLPVKDIEEFVNLVKEENPYAISTLDYFIDHLAIGLTNLIFILNCEVIVLNSYILREIPVAMQKLHEKIFLPITRYQDLYLSKLGKKAPLIGACNICVEQFYKSILTS